MDAGAGETLHAGCLSWGREAQRAPRISHMPPAAPAPRPPPHLQAPPLPRETELGPRTPSAHPLRSAGSGGGEARRCPAPHRDPDLPQRHGGPVQGGGAGRADHSSGRRGCGRRDGAGPRPRRDFPFPGGWRRGRRGGGSGALTLRAPAHGGGGDSAQPRHLRGTPRRIATGRDGISGTLRITNILRRRLPPLGLHGVARLSSSGHVGTSDAAHLHAHWAPSGLAAAFWRRAGCVEWREADKRCLPQCFLLSALSAFLIQARL